MVQEIPNSFKELNPRPQTPYDQIVEKKQVAEKQFDQYARQAAKLERQIDLAQKSSAAIPGEPSHGTMESHIIGNDVAGKTTALKGIVTKMQMLLDAIALHDQQLDTIKKDQ